MQKPTAVYRVTRIIIYHLASFVATPHKGPAAQQPRRRFMWKEKRSAQSVALRDTNATLCIYLANDADHVSANSKRQNFVRQRATT